MPAGKPCKLALADGLVFTGTSFGAEGTAEGEVVFNTGLTGYQEILTDPSYAGQIVAMTYPQIGNYGINTEDDECRDAAAQVRGFVIRDLSPIVSNFRSRQSLHAYLAAQGVLGLADIDTRALTRHIRQQGAVNGVLSTEITDDVELVRRAAAVHSMEGLDYVRFVSPRAAYPWTAGYETAFDPPRRHDASQRRLRVVAIDCGAKTNIFRNLVESGMDVTAVPATATAAEILEHRPDGVFVSNGPGDPAVVTYTIDALGGLLGKVPIFGICLGCQLLGVALGAQTYKMKFGHHGCNQPVRNELTGKVEITSQNHGFAVDAAGLERAGAVVTHVNLNDGSVEGFMHPDRAVFSVQYHPEAAPGPHDATYLFECFREMMLTGQSPTGEQMRLAWEAQARPAGS